MSGNLIEVSALEKHYAIGSSRLEVLKGIEFAVGSGEIVAVIGASGAGKSTLLHIVGTLDRPSAGTVRFDGEDVFCLNDEKIARFRSLRIGFVFQFHHLLPEFTALENVAMPALIAGKRMSDVRKRAMALLAEVGLDGRSEHRPSELSGGEQQRVAVARALVNEPRVVLADEPSGNLDSVNAESLHRLMLELCVERKTTFLIATHNDHLTSLAHRVLKIQDGVLVS